MQIIIDIPEDFIDKMNSIEDDRELSQAQLLTVYRGFYAMLQHGTPLPKEHGKLVDANEIAQMIEGAEVENESSRTFAENIIRFAPTIIEADKGE